jgi:CheY-like chemotaxis protein
VESTGNTGSVFCFKVALGRASMPKTPRNISDLAGRKILIVDDNATSCRILCRQFSQWGMMPRAVSSGNEALSVIAEADAFDLALVDVEMPEMSGLEVVAAIRRTRSEFQLPIVMLTRRGRPRIGDELGIAAFVSKPVKISALFESCIDILQGGRITRVTATAEGTALGNQHPLAILLAEDNPVNQRVAILMLQRLGYRADLAANGREALEAVERQRYDLVLMDVQMPEMDGLQATREIRARFKEAARPRIVAMTANASTNDRDECFAAGMDDFLTKPVRGADLRTAILATPSRAVASAA